MTKLDRSLRYALTGSLFLYVIAFHVSMAGMEIFAWTTFALVVASRALRRQTFPLPLWRPLAALIAVVGLTLWINPPLKPFLIQFGFMRWVILLWSFAWTLESLWDVDFERRLVTLWMTVTGVVAAYALLQFTCGVDWLRSSNHWLEPQGSVYRVAGTFSNSLTFAYAVGTAFFAVAGPFYSRCRTRGRAAVVTFASLVTLVPLVRGAVIAAMVAVFTGVACARRKLLPVFIGGTLAVIGALAVLSPRVMYNLRGNVENSSNMRVHLWRAYGQMTLDHPIQGVGLFQGDVLLPEYYARLGISETFASHAHNVILQWAAGAGILALLLYLSVAGWFLRAAWRLRRTSDWGWSLLLAQIYNHVGGLTEANFFDAEVNHVMVFTWALTLTLWRRSRAGGADSNQS